jgi:hypothetical protein
MAFTSLNTQIRVPQPPAVPAAVNNPTVVTPAGPHPEEIDKAFAGNHELRKRVHAAIGMLRCAMAAPTIMMATRD